MKFDPIPKLTPVCFLLFSAPLRPFASLREIRIRGEERYRADRWVATREPILMNPIALPLLALAWALVHWPPSPDPKPVRIVGVVVDDAGRLVGNADGWLAEAVSPAEGRRSGNELLVPAPAGPVAGESE